MAEHRRGGAAWRGMQGQRPLLWVTCVPACDQRTIGDVSRCVRRPRQEFTAGTDAEPTGGPRSDARPARGGLRGGLGKARGGAAPALAARRVARARRGLLKMLNWQCLTEIFSKLLNRSAQSGE
jgi:hypothetical protein